jgi:hypothetical protein
MSIVKAYHAKASSREDGITGAAIGNAMWHVALLLIWVVGL